MQAHGFSRWVVDACATCIHYGIQKTDKGLYTYCQRLGYETKPYYQFRCWTPKPHVRILMEKEKRKEGSDE